MPLYNVIVQVSYMDTLEVEADTPELAAEEIDWEEVYAMVSKVEGSANVLEVQDHNHNPLIVY